MAQGDLNIYTYRTKTPLITITNEVGYDIIGTEGQWEYIRFYDPIIPVWVSKKYVEIDSESNTATILIESLNARVTPTLDSRVINQIKSGYKSEISEIRNGFVQILAPTFFLYALNSIERSASNSVAINASLYEENNSSWIVGSNRTQVAARASEEVGLNDEILATYQKEISVSLTDTNTTLTDNGEITAAETNSVQQVFQVEPNIISTQSTSSTQYQLKSGDSISVVVFGEADLSLPTTRIPQSGVISFPLIGPVDVVNKTSQQIEAQLISTLSKGYINNPRLTVSIDSYRPIFIKGAVMTTGSFTFTEGLTVGQALSLAGGVEKTAKPNGVTVEREGRIFATDLSLNSNLKISSGDVLIVDEEIGYVEEDQLLYVYLHGEVNRPGEYKFRAGLTVEKAIVLAGGFSLRASKRKISVSRYTEDEEIPAVIKKVPLYFPINPGDIINVGASWF